MTSKPSMQDRILASQTLGVTLGAGLPEIRRAWRQAAFDMHPDRGGCAKAFAALSEAYQVLRETVPGEPTAQRREAPVEVSPQRPKRPSLRKRTEPIRSDAKSRCVEILRALAVQGQVATEARRTGRNVSYFFEDPAQEGANHVSVDIGDFIRRDSAKAVHVEVQATSSGQSTIELPEQTLSELFPGARRVRLHFAQPKGAV